MSKEPQFKELTGSMPECCGERAPFKLTVNVLVGMQTGAATVENSMEFPQKTKNETAF